MDKGLFDRAVRILSLREHSVLELRQKLAQKHTNTEQVEEVIRRCIALDYVNDARFAGVFAQSMARKGKGEVFIKLELRKRGISEDVASTALQGVEGSQEDIAYQWAQKKVVFLSGESPQTRRQKIARFLSSRGFSFDVVQTVLRRLEQ